MSKPELGPKEQELLNAEKLIGQELPPEQKLLARAEDLIAAGNKKDAASILSMLEAAAKIRETSARDRLNPAVRAADTVARDTVVRPTPFAQNWRST